MNSVYTCQLWSRQYSAAVGPGPRYHKGLLMIVVGENSAVGGCNREIRVRFVHTSAPEKKYIVESMSGGVLLIDYDRDGWQDIYYKCTDG